MIEDRINALNFDKSVYATLLVDRIHVTPYFEPFLKMFIEAYNCYVQGFLGASIVLAGESTMRLLCSKLYNHILDKGSIYFTERQNKKTRITNDEITEGYYYLLDKFSFNSIINASIASNIIDKSYSQTFFDIKDMRNIIIHKDFPVIDQWDPLDGKRNETEFMELLFGQKDIPEGYRIFLPNRQVFFDCSKKGCLLKKLSYEERIAAIQLYLVIDILEMYRNSCLV